MHPTNTPVRHVLGGPRAFGWAWAACALLIWAGWFGVTRAGVRGTIGVPDVAALRLGIGSLLLLPVFLPGARTIPPQAWRAALALSAAWGAPFVLLLGRGVQLTSAAHAAGMTPSTMPVFAGLLAWLFRGERPRPRRLAAYAVIVLAVLALALLVPGPRNLGGDAMLLAASVLWAIYTLLVSRSGLTPLQATTLTCVYSAVAFLPIYLAFGLSRLSQASGTELAVQIVYQGVFSGALATFAFTRAVARLGSASAAVVTSLVPVVATLLAIPIAGEWPSPVELAADAAIALGVWLATRTDRAQLRVERSG